MGLAENLLQKGMHTLERRDNFPIKALRFLVHSQIDRSLASHWPRKKGFGHSLIERGLADLGFDTKRLQDFIDVHLLSSKWKLFFSVGPDNLVSDFQAATALERRLSGAPRFLNQTFGIRNFGEFPEEALREQVETINDKEKPYILALRQASLAYDSPTIGRTRINSRIHEEARKLGALVRFAEFRTPYEFWKRINTVHRLFGSNGTGKGLGNVILLHHDAHGNVGLLGFESSKISPEKARSASARDLLDSKALARLGHMLPHGCPIVLASCKGGFTSKPGLTVSNADVIATMTGHPVYASSTDEIISSGDIVLKRSLEGGLDIDYFFIPEPTVDNLNPAPIRAKLVRPE